MPAIIRHSLTSSHRYVTIFNLLILHDCLATVAPVFTYWFCFLITVRGGVFHILGTLCELYPEHMTSYADKLVDMYLRTLKGEVRGGRGEGRGGGRGGEGGGST